ncbi:MAG: hypothetical protein NZ853_07340 [Leptospiraceae bacterium]|nr:hypothetical protein [Leptospiraceae bacterium]MDW7975752.1 hypothetical protein [Leptospiraceae bacterium]
MMYYVGLLFVLILTSCATKTKKERIQPTQGETKPQAIILQEQEERIDCNYFWAARQVHVCIKNIPKSECESLFASGQFIQEKDCYCDAYQKSIRKIETQGYIQYDCRHQW